MLKDKNCIANTKFELLNIDRPVSKISKLTLHGNKIDFNARR